MEDRLTVTFNSDVRQGEFQAQKIKVKQYLEDSAVLIAFQEDGTTRMHGLDSVVDISVD